MSDLSRLAGALRKEEGLRLRQGVVDAVNTDGTINVTIGGSTVVVEDVAVVGTPVPSESVWLLQQAGDILALGSPGGNATGASTFGIGPTDGQDTYPAGFTAMSVNATDGWPGNGEVITANIGAVRFGQLFIEKNASQMLWRGLVGNGPTLTGWKRFDNGIVAGVHRSATTTSIPNATWTQMAWPTNVAGDSGLISLNRFVAPTDGWYSIAATVGWQNNTSNRRIVRILKGTAANAAETEEIARNERGGGSSVSGKVVQSISGHDYLTAGTNVMVAVYQNSGVTLTCGAHDCYSNFSVVRLSQD